MKSLARAINGSYSKEKPVARPYTLSGLCIYLGCSESYFRTFEFNNTENVDDFIAVIETIKDIIKTQQYEGAIVGAFKENIIARLQGLKDSQDITTNGKDIKEPVWKVVDNK